MIPRFFSTAVIAVSLAAASSFALTDASLCNSNHNSVAVAKNAQCCTKNRERNCEEFKKDPIKALQDEKDKIQSMLRDGKITKEKADKITSRIEAKIKEIQEFNKLTVQEKKAKLIADFKASVEKKVKEGKIDKAKADDMLNRFTEKVNKWDGNGYPMFRHRQFKSKRAN